MQNGACQNAYLTNYAKWRLIVKLHISIITQNDPEICILSLSRIFVSLQLASIRQV